MFLRLRALCAVLAFASVSSCFAQAPAPAYNSDPKFQQALREGKTLERQHQMTFAADAYKKANKIAGGACVDCLMGLYKTNGAIGDYKGAIAAATALQGLMKTPVGKSYALRLRADVMLLQAGDKPKPVQLTAVDGVLKEALELDPKNASALYMDGKVLAQMGKMDDAKARFTECVHCVTPSDPAYVRAEHFAENPSLALHKMAPPFVVTALDGQKFNLDEMGGRVVLIDFWATWCGPCNEELPHMRKISKEFAGQPLVIISVSWDSDEAKWKEFIGKNEMTWVQYRDADHSLTKSFGVSAIPHYFTIDSDGVLTAEMMGSGSDVEGKLKKLIARAKQAQANAHAEKGGPVTLPTGD